MATTASDAALSRLTALHPSSIDLGLGRVERLLEALGEPQRNLPPVIHVAGTNGKGSTIAFMRAALEAAGKRVHAYTSPHLVSFHERITLGGRAIGEAELAALLREVEEVVFEAVDVEAGDVLGEDDDRACKGVGVSVGLLDHELAACISWLR